MTNPEVIRMIPVEDISPSPLNPAPAWATSRSLDRATVEHEAEVRE